MNQRETPTCSHYTLLHNSKFHIQRHFCARLFVRVSSAGDPVNSARNIVQIRSMTNYTSTYQHAPHAIIQFYILIQLRIQRHLLYQPVTCSRYYHSRQNCHIIHYYTHTRFTRHCELLKTTTLQHQNYSIQKQTPSSCIILFLFEP